MSDDITESDEKPLFQGIRYCVIGTLDKEIKDTLLKGKAKAETYLSALVTHAIVTDPTHYEVEAARDVWQIPTVTPSWVKMSILCKELLPTNGFLPFTDQLFSNTLVCFSNLPKQDKSTLWALITFHGGSCQAVLDSKCTHLVTPLPSGDKFSAAVKHEGISVVAPDWVTDSVKAKELQSCDKYNPELNIVPSPVKEPSPKQDVSEATDTLNTLSVKDSTVDKTQDKESNQQTQDKDESEVASAVPVPAKDIPDRHPAFQSNFAPNQLPFAKVSSQVLAPGTGAPNSSLTVNTPAALTSQVNVRSSAPQYGMMSNLQQASFTIPNAMPMRHPQTATSHHMAMASSNLQLHSAAPPTDQHLATSGLSTEQQHALLSPTMTPYAAAPPASSRAAGSPRKSSSSSGGKKKKSPAQSAPRPPMHSSIHQVHPQFQNNVQAIYSNQQQHLMIQKMRMAGNMEQMAPGQPMMEGSMVGARFPGMPGAQGRFPNPTLIAQREEGVQNAHHQQMMQQRMTMMRQNQPSSVQVMKPMGNMQAKWARAGLEGSSFPMDQHQQFFPHPQQGANDETQAMQQQQPTPSPMQQVCPPVMTQQSTPSPHPRYNPAMMNRFQNQMGQQQMMYQQMQQQQQQQHHNQARFPTSTSLEAAGMSGISPVALQQGLLNAEKMQADNPPLVHPSLQGMSPKASVPSQAAVGSTVPKKKAKSRKKVEGGGEEEGKSRPRQRNSKPKKPPTSPAVAPANVGQMQFANVMTSPAQFNFDGGNISPARTPVNFSGMAPSAQTIQFNAGSFVNQQASPQVMQVSTTSQMLTPYKIPTPQPTNSSENSQPREVLGHIPDPSRPNDKKTPASTVPKVPKPIEKIEVESSGPSRDFIDPLTYRAKELEAEYVTRDPAVSVPDDLFLLGCAFHIIEYNEVVNNKAVVELWKNMIGKYGGIVEEQCTSACTHLICVTCTTPIFKQALLDGKRCVTVYWLNDVIQLKTLRAPWLALHLPTHFDLRSKPAVNHTLSYTNFHAKERERLKMMGFVCGAKLTGYLSRNHTGLLYKEASGLKFEKATSWSIPCINALWLRDVLQGVDTALVDIKQEKYNRVLTPIETAEAFLLDLSKSQRLLDSWKVPIVVTHDCLARAHVKHKIGSMPTGPSEPKRPKEDVAHRPLPRVCFTGLSPTAVQDLKKKLESLNGRSENTFALCTHLVTKNIARTVKFLSCISCCSYIVTPEWIEESFKSNWFLDEGPYSVRDRLMEERFLFSLQESLRRAKKAALFKDCFFCVTSSVTPEVKVLKQIVECAGGRLLNKIPPLSVLKHMRSRKTPDRTVVVISCPEDEKVYKPLKKEGLMVHNAEFILTGVLKQEINKEAYRL